MNTNTNTNDKGKGEQGKGSDKGKGAVTPKVSAAKLSEGTELVRVVLATVKANYESDLAATTELGRWVKATTAGKRGSKVTLNDLVKAFDGAPGTSKSALSKAMTVAATSAAQRKDYLTNAGERPTVDGLYLSVRVVTPRAETAETAETADAETAEPETAVFADSDVEKVARDFIAGLRTRGATTVQINLVIAELDRLVTPVRSVKAA